MVSSVVGGVIRCVKGLDLGVSLNVSLDVSLCVSRALGVVGVCGLLGLLGLFWYYSAVFYFFFCWLLRMP